MPQPRILIVEDELIVALELEDRLRRQGYAVVGPARSVDEALALVETATVDLALLDVRLDGPGDGIEFAEHLRARGLPFVFLTAHGDDDTLARIKSAEPLGYLLKPFDGRLLHLTIETALHRHAAERGRIAAERGRIAAERGRLAAERAQAMLAQRVTRARQLELAGRVASGIGHDLNSLLSIIRMSAYMLRDASSRELPELLDELEAAVDLGAALTTRLLSLAGRRSATARVFAVNDALRAIARLVRRALGGNVELTLDLDPEAGSIRLDPALLDQVVLNLALNADRAMPAGGRLTLRSRADVRAGDPVVHVEVEDTGVGIDPSVGARMFEPFFTTRGEAGGTGLGLAVVKDIVEQVGGALDFESTLGQGTTFRLTLARQEEI